MQQRKKKKKDQWRCQPFGPHLPAKISFQSTLHPSTGSRRCNEIIFSFARPSLRFFCAGFLLNAGHKIVGYGRTITQTTSSRRRANIERERTGQREKAREKETQKETRSRRETKSGEGIRGGGKKGSVNEMSFGRIKVVAQVPIPFFQFFQAGSMRVYTRRERNRLVINRLGRLGHSAKRSRSRPLEESLARPVVASRAVAPGPISRAPSCCARLADDN